ncbi:hypothetical protein ACFQX6_05775 [Streptosporangium lutulentum]
MSAPAVPESPRPAVEPARDPYQVYLDSLTSAESRRAMRGCLDRLAALISGDEVSSGASQPWHLLRYEHTVRLRALMTERGWSPPTSTSIWSRCAGCCARPGGSAR